MPTSANAEVATDTRDRLYAQRAPEYAELYGVDSEQLGAFFTHAESAGREVRAFVVGELIRYRDLASRSRLRSAQGVLAVRKPPRFPQAGNVVDS